MEDVQNSKPTEHISLNKVGITDFDYPISIERKGKSFDRIVNIQMSVDLPEHQKGAHMSRFIEEIEIPKKTHSIESLARRIGEGLLKKHDYAKNVEVKLSTKMGYKKGKIAELYGCYNGKQKVGVTVHGNTTCPCAIEMTGGTSHNQRAKLKVLIESDEDVEVLDLIHLCEDSFSVPLEIKLKRKDEKELVEKMHSNPKFVEDVVRKCVSQLKEKYPGKHCSVKATSMESIHPYNVFSEWEGTL